MTNIPSRVADRLVTGLRMFQPILSAAKARDINESDTGIVVTDILAQVLGYDKYSEVTSEHLIRGTYCDLAIKLDGKVQVLVEIKAVNIDLKEGFVKQAIDYAANQGVDWVVLTNGCTWRVYRVIFAKPIDQELVFEFDFIKLNHKSVDDLILLYLISKEGWLKKVLGDFHEQRQALSRFFVGATVLTDPVLDAIRRELKRVCPDVRIQNEQIQNVLVHEVLKREVVEGEKAGEARKKIARYANRPLRNARTAKDQDAPALVVAPESEPQSPPEVSGQ